ncbi:MAG: hypothetical protein ACP5QA_14305 [Phycisphaerae bacterium]
MKIDSRIESQVAQDFSLRKVAGLLEHYTPPPVAGFAPAGNWKHEYTMYLLDPQVSIKSGAFTLERFLKGTQHFAMTVQMRAFGISGFSLFQHAVLQCRTDTLAAPVSWEFETKMSRRPGDKPYLLTGRHRSAKVSDGYLMIRDKLATSRTMIHGPYSNEWTLLEAVQRLPGESMKQIHYTLIDEYDTPQPDHSLAFRTRAKMSVANGPLHLVGYYDLGRAVIPTVYWVDQHGRLIFVCTGLVVYALAATNGQSGICPERYPAYRA